MSSSRVLHSTEEIDLAILQKTSDRPNKVLLKCDCNAAVAPIEQPHAETIDFHINHMFIITCCDKYSRCTNAAVASTSTLIYFDDCALSEVTMMCVS